ncbi:MAG: hypothetical protein HY619_01815 [Thaumarchaeota archaeon]|nr:hypothetical protein [Nitrososphaerota archaeon]
MPPGSETTAHLFLQVVFAFVSLAVFFFVLSANHLTSTPRTLETLFFSTPLITILLLSLFGAFTVTLSPYGWQGNISNPFLRYFWLTLVVLIMAYSILRLFTRRNNAKEGDRKRLTIFLASVTATLVLGTLFFILTEFAEIPILSVVVVNLTFFPAHYAYPPYKKEKPVQQP